MTARKNAPLAPLTRSPRVREAAAALLEAIAEESNGRALEAKAFEKTLQTLGRARGRELAVPYLGAGRGEGARVALADGSTRIDFVGGIGVQAFGHGDQDLQETAAVAAASDAVFQSHLHPGPEYLRLSQELLRLAGRRMRHVWLALTGAMANENALKMIFQKRAPADRIVAFENGFHGRTLAMAELTDRPAYREGLPLRGFVDTVPFFDPSDDESIEKSVAALDGILRRYPGRVAGMCFELVQGEGGFQSAPREFFAALMEHCRKHEVAVWVDEVQTFGRTGELFAYQTLGLEPYVDVVTAGKMLQGSATLFTAAYAPQPGLVSGTFAGNTVGMAVGARILERLCSEGYLGPEGRVALLGRRIEKRLESLRKGNPRAVRQVVGLGAMRAFVPYDGAEDTVSAIVDAAFEEGLMLLAAGSEPTKIRFLPPLNTTDEELEAGFAILDKALRRVGEQRGLLR